MILTAIALYVLDQVSDAIGWKATGHIALGIAKAIAILVGMVLGAVVVFNVLASRSATVDMVGRIFLMMSVAFLAGRIVYVKVSK